MSGLGPNFRTVHRPTRRPAHSQSRVRCRPAAARRSRGPQEVDRACARHRPPVTLRRLFDEYRLEKCPAPAKAGAHCRTPTSSAAIESLETPFQPYGEDTERLTASAMLRFSDGRRSVPHLAVRHRSEEHTSEL